MCFNTNEAGFHKVIPNKIELTFKPLNSVEIFISMARLYKTENNPVYSSEAGLEHKVTE